jgi:predicted dithiol-disulfide oxidoreductase (DUF899 family)
MPLDHRTGTREEWRAARATLLEREKELTRLNDVIARERQALPWVPVEQEYVFDSPDGPVTLAELFGGRSQLIVQHLMFGPDDERACASCTSIADGVNGPHEHLEHHDVAFAAVSRAPLAKLQEYKAKLGWTFRWVSSHGSDFNFDFGVSGTAERPNREYNLAPVTGEQTGEWPGMSAFALRDGVVHHVYSAHSRGIDALWGVYAWLDRAPKGRRDETYWHRRRYEFEEVPA